MQLWCILIKPKQNDQWHNEASENSFYLSNQFSNHIVSMQEQVQFSPGFWERYILRHVGTRLHWAPLGSRPRVFSCVICVNPTHGITIHLHLQSHKYQKMIHVAAACCSSFFVYPYFTYSTTCFFMIPVASFIFPPLLCLQGFFTTFELLHDARVWTKARVNQQRPPVHDAGWMTWGQETLFCCIPAP